MDSASIHNESPIGGVEISGPHSPCRRILPELLPSILSYVPIPHLHHRLVNSEWDHAMKLAHSLGQCDECEAKCASAQELHMRMHQLALQTNNEEEMIWMNHWKLDDCSKLPQLESNMTYIQSSLVPFLDSLKPPRCSCSITLGTNHFNFRADILASWCLEHSYPAKYNFFCPVEEIDFQNEDKLSSFLRAPSMRHVSLLTLGVSSLLSPDHLERYSLHALRDCENVCNLKSLTIMNVDFRSEDIDCLLHSPHLSNLTHLKFSGLSGLEGMKGADRTSSFDTIVCSPIMKNVKSFEIAQSECELGYGLAEFAQSKYLQNLQHLSLGGSSDDWREWSLEPLLRCDCTMPNLTSLFLDNWTFVSAETLGIISSSASALFNRLQSLDLSYCPILPASMRVLCASDGLTSLTRLTLLQTQLDEALELVASAPSSFLSSLKILNLSYNYALTNAAVVALYSSANLPNLQSLNFSGCHKITSDVLQELQSLPPRPNLRLLVFSFDITAESMRRARAEWKLLAPELELMHDSIP